MPQPEFTLPAFAKINLALRVLGRREDGYHEIETIFQTISLHDRLTFEPRADGQLELVCTAPGVPTDETNLVLRAAKALSERYDVNQGARVHLEKTIPTEAGLGGGSSNAAAALCGLASLWGLKTRKAELVRIGSHLGADVPFFLTGGTALGKGIGTDLTPLADAPQRALVVVTPGVKVSTARAYKLLSAPALTKEVAAVKLPISRAEPQIWDSLYEVMRNDFEPVVFRLKPEIARVRDALIEQGARAALLAGSGSSVFGVFENSEAANAAAVVLAAETHWRAFACQTLTRVEYVKRLGPCAEFLRGGGGDEIGA